MAISVTAVTAWNGVPNDGVNISSGSFTPPAGAVILVCVTGDTDNNTTFTATVDDAATALTWTNAITRQSSGSDGDFGHVAYWWAVANGSSVTVRVRRTKDGGGTFDGYELCAKAWYITGADTVDPIGATASDFWEPGVAAPTKTIGVTAEGVGILFATAYCSGTVGSLTSDATNDNEYAPYYNFANFAWNAAHASGSQDIEFTRGTSTSATSFVVAVEIRNNRLVGIAYGNDEASGTSLATSGSITVQEGDAIIVAVKHEGADGATITISDNAAGGSNIYTSRQARYHSADPLKGAIFTAIAKASETLTFTFGLDSARVYRIIHAVAGRPDTDKVFVYDNSASSEAPTSDAPTTGSFSVAGVGGFAVASFALYASRNGTPGTGWTEAIDLTEAMYTEYWPLDSETSIAGNCDLDNTTNIVSLAVAMKMQSSGQADPDAFPQPLPPAFGVFKRVSGRAG